MTTLTERDRLIIRALLFNVPVLTRFHPAEALAADEGPSPSQLTSTGGADGVTPTDQPKRSPGRRRATQGPLE